MSVSHSAPRCSPPTVRSVFTNEFQEKVFVRGSSIDESDFARATQHVLTADVTSEDVVEQLRQLGFAVESPYVTLLVRRVRLGEMSMGSVSVRGLASGFIADIVGRNAHARPVPLIGGNGVQSERDEVISVQQKIVAEEVTTPS